MVFVHGGSFMFGSAMDAEYNGAHIASLTRDVIVVVVNYRLNVFGFLASAVLKQQSPDGSAGNYGLQDQRFALQWVKRNAAAFGGNSNLVTLFGESAGSASVALHLLSPLSTGLYHRAILQSGAFSSWIATTFNSSVAKYIAVASIVGCCPTSSCSDSDPAVLACLRATDAYTLLATIGSVPTSDGGVNKIEWNFVIDGVEVLGDPLTLAAAGAINNVPVLLGSNGDEGTIFSTFPATLNAAEYDYAINEVFGPQLGPLLLAQYPLSAYPDSYQASARLIGEMMFNCPARQSAKWMVQGRANLLHPQPVYVYFFNYTSELTKQIAPQLGSFHGSELYLVFDDAQYLVTPQEVQLGKAMVSLWTMFAKTGVPSASGRHHMAEYSMETQLVSTLDVGSIVTYTSHWKEANCDFWNAVGYPNY